MSQDKVSDLPTEVNQSHQCSHSDAPCAAHTQRKVIEELEWLRSRYTALSWGPYDPFKKLDERIAELKALKPNNQEEVSK